ncbi:MAG TPA: Calx-beta domain-containing protein, partial [Pyrinomonadaceae bacterium]|nr:Calx-beta domain-containing protein [Pyrinomonadaceae bacterium]
TVPQPVAEGLSKDRTAKESRLTPPTSSTPAVVPAAIGPADRNVIAGGGGATNGGNFKVDATLGEPIASNAQGGAFTVGNGYWNGLTKADQTIAFAPLGNKALGDPPFTVSATGGPSGNAVTFSSAAPGLCSVSGNTVTILAAGFCTVRASLAGNINYNDAIDVAQSFTIANSALIAFSQSSNTPNEVTGVITITVNRGGDLSVPVTVDYATDDTGADDDCSKPNTGLASARCDFGLTLGTLRFAANETQKTFLIPITQDSFNEGPEVFTVNLTNATGAGARLFTPSSATVTINDSPAPASNAIDDTEAFVRQQYRDFLNRDADPSGLAFWKDNIDQCNDAARRPSGQSVAECLEVMRINTSAAFFLSIEFQQSGNFVRSCYVAALDRPATNNMPALVEFLRDTQEMQRGVVVNQGNWQQTLDNNRDAFIRDFVMRAAFVGLYPTTDTPTQYVDKLYLHANVTPDSAQERNNAIAEFGGAAAAADAGARGRALLRITQNSTFQSRETNRSFVQMQFFGYL